MCDDENVEPIDEADIFRYFGDYPSGAGYVMFYQAADLDLSTLGLDIPAPVMPAAKTEPAKPETLIEVDEHADEPPSPIHPVGTNGYAHTQQAPAVQRTPEQATNGHAPSPLFINTQARAAPPTGQRTPSQPIVQRTPSQSVQSTPSQPTPSQSIQRTPSQSAQSVQRTPSQSAQKDADTKWYQRKKTDASPSTVSNGLGGASSPMQPSASAEKTESPVPDLARRQSSRAVSGGSSASYAGGSGLGRKLSGISGKGLMSRSGSLMKLGLGKKEKKDGIEE
jgi:ubiquitin carboxyl-terminal hydrolase 9/13